MPKKKCKDEIVTDAGLVLNKEQAAIVRKQMYEGSYGLDAPDITVTDDDITVRVGATVYTVYGDSPLLTTTVLRRSETTYTPAALSGDDVGYAVRDALDRARDAADAVIKAIKAINDEWETNVGDPDDVEGADEDEGLREGPVVGSGSGVYFVKGTDLPDDDWIRIPNAEYADLIADSRRLYLLELEIATADSRRLEALKLEIAASKRAAVRAGRRQRASQPFEMPVPADANDSEVDIEALNVAFAGIPSGPYDVTKHAAGWEVRQLDTDPTNKHHWPVRLCQNISGHKPGFGDATATFIAGVLNAWPLIAARLAATESDAAPDVSDAVFDDGGPVEPELDIDALVAGIDVEASVNGRPVPVTVELTVGGRTAKFTSNQRAADDLRKAFADAQRAGGLR